MPARGPPDRRERGQQLVGDAAVALGGRSGDGDEHRHIIALEQR
jgi:hypothetical protein